MALYQEEVVRCQDCAKRLVFYKAFYEETGVGGKKKKKCSCPKGIHQTVIEKKISQAHKPYLPKSQPKIRNQDIYNSEF